MDNEYFKVKDGSDVPWYLVKGMNMLEQVLVKYMEDEARGDNPSRHMTVSDWVRNMNSSSQAAHRFAARVPGATADQVLEEIRTTRRKCWTSCCWVAPRSIWPLPVTILRRLRSLWRWGRTRTTRVGSA